MQRIRIGLLAGVIAWAVAFGAAAAWAQPAPPGGPGPAMPGNPGNMVAGGAGGPAAAGDLGGGSGGTNPPPASDTSPIASYALVVFGCGLATFVVVKTSRR